MSAPNWNAYRTAYDVLVFWYMRRELGGLSQSAVYKFALERTVKVLENETWEGYRLRGSYPGLVKAITPHRAGFGTEIKPKIIFPTITLTLLRDGSDDISSLMDDLKQYSFGGLDVVSKVAIFIVEHGQSPDVEQDLFYVAHVDPNSVKINPDTVELTLTDRTKNDNIELPVETVREAAADDLTRSNYVIDPAWERRSVPILWGDWDDAAVHYQVEVPCIDVDNDGKDFAFILSKPMGQGIGQFATGTRQIMAVVPGLENECWYQIYDGDPSTGIFFAQQSANDPLDDNTFIWEEGTRFFIKNPIGNLDADGALVENPADIWFYLLTFYAAVADQESIDPVSFMSIRGYLQNLGYKARRWINEPCELMALIEELCFEFGIFSFVKNDKYTLAKNSFYMRGQSQQTFFAANLLKGRYEILLDPSSWQVSGIRLRYKYKPQEDDFASSVFAPNPPIKPEEIQSKWIGHRNTALDRASKLYLAHGNPALAVKTTIIKRGMGLHLADSFTLEHTDVDGDDFQIYEMNTQIDKGLTEVTAFSSSWYFDPGYWTSDEAPDYESATYEEKETQGFWTDDDGYCDSGEPGSNDSNWTD